MDADDGALDGAREWYDSETSAEPLRYTSILPNPTTALECEVCGMFTDLFRVARREGDRTVVAVSGVCRDCANDVTHRWMREESGVRGGMDFGHWLALLTMVALFGMLAYSLGRLALEVLR